MKNLKLFVTSLLLTTFFVNGFAQKRVDGNGNIVKNVRSLPLFTEIEIELNATIAVHCQQKPEAIVTVDENIQRFIITKVEGNKLLISQEGWPESTKGFQIDIYVPFINKIVNDSWSKLSVENLNTEHLEINSSIGDMAIAGKVSSVAVQSKNAKIDMEKLLIEEADINISGRGEVRIAEVESLSTDINQKGHLIYNKEEVVENSDPNSSEKKRSAKRVEYVQVRIQNNSLSFPPLRIQGPDAHPFSYGFRIFPGFSKLEKVPVGTQIYKENSNAGDDLLLTIQREDADKKLSLF